MAYFKAIMAYILIRTWNDCYVCQKHCKQVHIPHKEWSFHVQISFQPEGATLVTKWLYSCIRFVRVRVFSVGYGRDCLLPSSDIWLVEQLCFISVWGQPGIVHTSSRQCSELSVVWYSNKQPGDTHQLSQVNNPIGVELPPSSRVHKNGGLE